MDLQTGDTVVGGVERNMTSSKFQNPEWNLNLLPAASRQFLVVTDTHYILPDNAQAAEWSAVAEFPVRTERALRMASSLPRDFAVHLGDISHEYPETGRAEVAHQAALDQFASLGLKFAQAAGNMDIGDKPDPTSPAQWVTAATLAGWHSRVGRSWQSFDAAGIHGIVLNTQIMNGPLPEAAEQASWAERDLQHNAGKRMMLFLHMPVYYVNRHEHSTGFYNSLDEPARSWLLQLIEDYNIEFVFSGHTHTIELNRHGDCRLWTVPSTATSRAGLAEAYALVPPDRGRGDVDKLGFYFVRETANGTSMQLVRTGRDTIAMTPGSDTRIVMTRTSRDLPSGRLGLFASHPLGHANPGPVIWPSIVRQPVRDDFRLTSVLELGARFLRIPASDLSTASEADRLQVLRDEGVALSPYWLWTDHIDLVATVSPHLGDIDSVEIVLPGESRPGPAVLESLQSLRQLGKPVCLSPAIVESGEQAGYHQRTRVGFWPREVAELDERLATHDLTLDRIACRMTRNDPGRQVLSVLDQQPQSIRGIDWYLDLTSENDLENANLVARAIAAIAAYPSMRLVLGPHVDLDRSMDLTHGLIDRLSNPRPAFVVARMLNSIFFGENAGGDSGQKEPGDAERRVWVIARQGSAETELPADLRQALSDTSPATLYDLIQALSWTVQSADDLVSRLVAISGPWAVVI